MSEKRVIIAIVAVIIVIAIISVGFLLVTADAKECEICGMSSCNMDHGPNMKCVNNTVKGDKCVMCGVENCKMDYGNATNDSSHQETS
jgi:uncharacterized transporter YbjL